MTAPTSMPVLPAVGRSSCSTSSSASVADSSPRFARALDSALDDTPTGGGTTAGSAPGSDAEQVAAAGTEDVVATAPVVLVPGLWALMTAVSPLTSAATGTAATTAAASLISAVTGMPGPAAPIALPVPAPVPVPVPDPTAGPPAVAVDPATTAALALADAAGLELVVDAAPAPGPATGGAPAAQPGAGGPAPLLPTAGAAGQADTGPGSDGATGGPAVAVPATDETPSAPGTDPVFTVGGTTQTTATGPVAEVTAPPAPADDAPVAAQLGRHIAVLRNAPDGSQTMTVVITPESLGPVTIAVTVTDGTLDLTLQGASEHGRHALRDALPDLRRDLEDAGLSFSRLEVGTDSDAGPGGRSAQQQLLDARAGQQGGPGQQQPRTWGSATDPVLPDGTPLTTGSSTSTGVDVRV